MVGTEFGLSNGMGLESPVTYVSNLGARYCSLSDLQAYFNVEDIIVVEEEEEDRPY